MMENLKMKTLAKLALAKPGAAALLAGAVFVPALNANAVEHTADFTLQAAPAVVTLTHTSNTDFGTITIPVGKGVTRWPKTNGVMTIGNATDGTTYSVTVGYEKCPTDVDLSASANYNGVVVSGATTRNITFDSSTSTTLTMGGVLLVNPAATAGPGTCTYDVTIAAAASGG